MNPTRRKWGDFAGAGLDLHQGAGALGCLIWQGNRKETSMIPVSQRKIQLETRLRDLVARLATIDAELDSHQSKDWEDLATEREADEVLEGMGLSGQQEIRQIEAALGRIASGDYGVCATCGDQISEERLDVLPYTPFCRNCAA
jgi:RNA polymerase-binding transcription factor DksA